MKHLTLLLALVGILASCAKDSKDRDSWNDSVVPVDLTSIEAVNIDNSGEFPVAASTEINKNAYMLGVKWVTKLTPSTGDDKFVTDPIRKGEDTYESLGYGFSYAIKCNTQFSTDIPAGSYVSKFFKKVDSKYVPNDIDEGFVLLTAPDPGPHSFTIEYYEDANYGGGKILKHSKSTPTINFY
ncbi:MAG: hypothetical protein LBU91_07120 [Bacteroidales bacterium]|jgi:hypothetical protein|nr:hypothetical protein [Bacteroidales bacterium]